MTTISLFLHSTGTGPFLWESVSPDVVAGTTKIAPAHLGYPPNDLLPRGQTCDARADARRVMREIPEHARDIHVFAHSYGGVVALELVPLLAGRVRSMFLYEPVMFGALAHDGATDAEIDPGAIEDARSMLEHPWFLTDDAKGGSDPWLEMFIDYWNKPGSWSRIPEHIQSYSRMTGWKMYQEVRACFFGIESFADVHLGDVPTTLVMGERSPRASARWHALSRTETPALASSSCRRRAT